MPKIHKPLSIKDRKSMEDLMAIHRTNHLIYAPGSVWHGWPNDGNHKDVTKLKIELARLNDFVEFLFEQSEHCDHITQSEAWNQYEEHTFRTHKA